jgi:hypothetical protein
MLDQEQPPLFFVGHSQGVQVMGGFFIKWLKHADKAHDGRLRAG